MVSRQPHKLKIVGSIPTIRNQPKFRKHIFRYVLFPFQDKIPEKTSCGLSLNLLCLAHKVEIRNPTLTTWSRTGVVDAEQLTFRVKLSPQQWTTVNAQGERPGYDHGGDVGLIGDIFNAVRQNENFSCFSVDRRASKTTFLPEIIVKDEVLPEHMTTPKAIQALGLGTQYDVYISFPSKEEMTLFKLSFSGGVNVGFQGIN